jgi:alkaline phosphatase
MSARRTLLVLAALAAATPLALTAPIGAAVGAAGPGAALTGPVPDRPLARNVIVMLDDGGGYNQHEAGSLYDTGARAGEVYQHFPFRSAMSTYSYGPAAPGTCPAQPLGYDAALAWSQWDYVSQDPTDSAAAATAMATGAKTYNRAIGVDCTGQSVPDIAETFEGLGKSTGVVTSSAFSSATPASFVAHNVDRYSEVAIARDMVESSATDVIMGAGHPSFDATGSPIKPPVFKFIGARVWNGLVAGTEGGDANGDGTPDPFTLVQTRDEFRGLIGGDTPSRVFGMAQVAKNLQVDRPGDPMADPYAVPFLETVPTLSEMTLGALNVLDENPDGFFLMSEGGGTDVAAANGEGGRMVEEEISFDRAVDSVVRWVEENSNWGETLVLVVSDHETGYLTGPGSGPTADAPVWTPLTDHGQGVLPGLQFNRDGHTNSLVPVYAKGDAGRLLRTMVDGTDPVRGGYVDNTDLHQLLLETVGLTASADLAGSAATR